MRYLNLVFVCYSAFAGYISHLYIPRRLRTLVYKSFGRTGLTRPFGSYSTISEFFSSPMDLKLRPLTDADIVSPCDGRIIECGNIDPVKSRLRIKGYDYNIKELVGEDTELEAINEVTFISLYLAPSDYHRFHAPCSVKIERITHIPGLSFPVNKFGQNLLKDLYAKNERLSLYIKNKDFALYMVMVGACAVRGIKTIKGSGDTINKGEELGRFELGSSIVLIFNKKLELKNKFSGTYVKVRSVL